MFGTRLSQNCWYQLWSSKLLEEKQIGAAGIRSVGEKTLCLKNVFRNICIYNMESDGSEEK